MIIERTKNATRGIMAGLVLRVYQMIIPFVMRTVMIYFLGIQYLGLNSLFASILQVLNLAELGVGQAMVFSMYKPISEDNTEEICALMELYKKYYRIIGAVIGGLGIALLPFLRYLIKGDVPADINIYILYILNLAATVLTYWLFAYKNCLLEAHQRVDVISYITLFVNMAKYALQIIVVICFRNYYLYMIILILSQIMNNITTANVTSRMFPEYHAKGNLPKEKVQDINGKIKDFFTAKLGGVILNSADSIVISTFLGLTILAIYQNYFTLISSVIAVIQIAFTSMLAGIGNSLITEDKEKVFADFKKFSFIFQWIIGFCSICFLCLFQPFMKIWVGEDLMLGMSIVVLLCIYFYLCEMNRVLNLYKDAAGLWHIDRFRPLTSAFVNLTLNLLLVNYMGIYGVILSTVVAMLFVEIPWLVHNLFTVLFERGYRNGYVSKMSFYALVSLVVAVVTYGICSALSVDNKWLTLIIRGLICISVPNILYGVCFCRLQEFKQGKQFVIRVIKSLQK